MRNVARAAAGTMTAAALVAAMAGSAAAAAYSGVFTGPVRYVGCTERTTGPALAGGTWSITTHQATARGVFDITVNGQPHVAYTYPNLRLQPVLHRTALSGTGTTLAGPLTVTLTGDRLTYVIAPYDLNGLQCTSVTYTGTATP